MPSHGREFVAECYWPGVTEPDLERLDARVHDTLIGLGDGAAVHYLGSLLMREDEVVLCRFEGSEQAVRSVAERAAVPFERILEAAASPWNGERPESGDE